MQQQILSAASQVKLACYKQLLGDAAGAAATFAKASELLADSRTSHSCASSAFAQALPHMFGANMQGALYCVDKADAAQPNDADILQLRGVIKHMLGDHAGAVMDLANRAYLKNAFWKLAASQVNLGAFNLAQASLTAIAKLAQESM